LIPEGSVYRQILQAENSFQTQGISKNNYTVGSVICGGGFAMNIFNREETQKTRQQQPYFHIKQSFTWNNGKTSRGLLETG
jgi:hypothetical protein